LLNRALAPFGPSRVGRRFGGVDDLMAAAERRTGLDEWGDPHFRDGLETLLESLERVPDLTPLGAATFNNLIRSSLVNRLRFLSDSAPRLDLRPPIIITGLPRSGTTALHRLLAVEPEFHAPPLWELQDPFTTAAVDLRKWRSRAQIGIKNRILPELDAMHFTRAETPEECTLLLANSFASPLLWDMTPLDGYLEWYQKAPQKPVYREYRRQLELLQARHPGQQLLLKAPAHLPNLSVLQEVIPEARLIQTHRDPTACFSSHCSLREILSSFVVEQPDRPSIVDQVGRVFEHDLRANAEFHERSPGSTVHVSCSTLQRAPIEAVRVVREALDLGWDRETEKRAEVHQRPYPNRRPGLHRRGPDDWTVPKDELDRSFVSYREAFADLLKV
jgi:hypothetical protein